MEENPYQPPQENLAGSRPASAPLRWLWYSAVTVVVLVALFAVAVVLLCGLLYALAWSLDMAFG